MSNGPTVRVVQAGLGRAVEQTGPDQYDVIDPVLRQMSVKEFPRPDIELALFAVIERQPRKRFVDVTAEIVDSAGDPVTQPKTAHLSTEVTSPTQSIVSLTVEFDAVHLPAAGLYRARLLAEGTVIWEQRFTATLSKE